MSAGSKRRRAAKALNRELRQIAREVQNRLDQKPVPTMTINANQVAKRYPQ